MVLRFVLTAKRNIIAKIVRAHRSALTAKRSIIAKIVRAHRSALTAETNTNAYNADAPTAKFAVSVLNAFSLRMRETKRTGSEGSCESSSKSCRTKVP
jgi:hypothetical protein